MNTHKPTSPQAHKRSYPSMAAIKVVCQFASMLACLPACEHLELDHLASQPATTGSVVDGPVQMDLGILFAAESSYICLPLKRLGFPAGVSVTRIDSSCACVQPKLVDVQTIEGPAGALRIDIHPESKSDSKDAVPHSLAVELDVHFSTGQQRSIVLQFLETRTVASLANSSLAAPQMAIGRGP